MTAALESFSDKLDAWTTVLLTELFVVLMTTTTKTIREVSVSIKTSSSEEEEDFPLSRPIFVREKSVRIKQNKRTIVIQRATPSREDQIHVPFGGNLVRGNLLAS